MNINYFQRQETESETLTAKIMMSFLGVELTASAFNGTFFALLPLNNICMRAKSHQNSFSMAKIPQFE